MAVSEDYLNYVLEQLEHAGTVTPKRMFGGVGLYMDDVFFALIADDVLRFKVDDTNRADYEKAGMEPFRPYKDRKTIMDYYEVPIDVLEDRAELKLWAEKAIDAALRKK